MGDLRYAIRRALLYPSFVCTVGVTLGIGASAAVAVWSSYQTILGSASTIPADVVNIYRNTSGQPRLSYSEFVHIDTNRGDMLRNVAAIAGTMARVSGDLVSSRAVAEFVSADYFALFKVSAIRGRVIQRNDVELQLAVAVVSDDLAGGLWPGRQPIGQTLTLDGVKFVVVGVVAREFRGAFAPNLLRTQVWVPLSGAMALQGEAWSVNSNFAWLSVKAGLADERGLPETAEYVRAVMTSWEGTAGALASAGTTRSRLYSVVPATEVVFHESLEPLLVPLGAALFLATGSVLFLACVNLVGVQLSRNLARQPEFAMRGAMGATRTNLIAMLLLESWVASLAAVPVAACTALVMISAVRAYLPSLTGVDVSLTPPGFWNVTVVAAVFVTIGAAVIGVWPALAVNRIAPLHGLAMSPVLLDNASSKRRSATMIAQFALTTALLVTAVAIHQRWSEVQAPEEWQQAGLVWAELLGDDAEAAQRLIDELRRFHELATVSQVDVLPFDCPVERLPQRGQGPDLRACVVRVDPHFADVVGVRLLAGRFLQLGDIQANSAVAVVSNSVWNHLAASRDSPTHVDLALNPADPMASFQIVGIVSDIAPGNDNDAPGTIYLPLQAVDDRRFSIVVKPQKSIAAAPTLLVESIARSYWPRLEVSTVEPITARLERQNWPRKAGWLVLGFLGVVASLLVAVGTFGTVRADVLARVHEWGVRIALGASPRTLLRLALKRSSRLLLAGQVLGVALAVGSWQLVAFTEPTLGAVARSASISCGFMWLAGMVVCYLSVRPMLKLDPVKLVRHLQP